MLAGGVAVVDRLDRPALIFLDATTLSDPLSADAAEPVLDVNRHIAVGVGAGGVIDRQRRLA